MKKNYSILKMGLLTALFFTFFSSGLYAQKLHIYTSKTYYCPGETAVLEASSGFSKYLWNTSSKDRIIKVQTAGKYIVTAWDSIGRPQTDSIEIFYYKTATLTISTKNNPICKGDTVWLEASSGFLKYLWSTNDTTRLIRVSPSSTTSYYVYALDSNGCKVKTTYTLQVKSCGSSPCKDILAGNPTKMCKGGYINLEAKNGYKSYLWSNSKTDRVIKITEAGKYYITVTDSANNTCHDSITITYFDTKKVEISTNPTPAKICKGQKITLEATAGFKSYYWSNQATTRVFVSDPTVTTTFWVYAVDSNNCVTKDTIEVKVDSCKNTCKALFSKKELKKCTKDSIHLEAPNGYAAYFWSLGNKNVGNTRLIWAKEAGKYILTVRDSANNYCSDTLTIIDTCVVHCKPLFKHKELKKCTNDSIQLEGPSGYLSYYWTNGSKYVNNDRKIWVKVAGMYILQVKDSSNNYCKDTLYVIDTCKTTYNCKGLFSKREFKKCGGDSIHLEGPNGFAYYYWTKGNNYVNNTRLIWAKEPGVYVLWVKDSANNYCNDTIWVTNYEQKQLQAGPYPVKSQYCIGDTISWEASAGFKSYAWSNKQTSRGFKMALTNSFVMELVVTDSIGCKQVRTWKINVIDCKNIDSCAHLITAYPKISICQGDSIKLLGKEGMSSYSWSNHKNDRYFWTKDGGKYVLEAKTPGGKTCRDSVELTVFKRKDFKLTTKPNPAIICPGDTVIFEASSGMKSYSWNLGKSYMDRRVEIILKEGKKVVVEATDSNGCNYRQEVTVKIDSSCAKYHSSICKDVKIYPNPVKSKLTLERRDTLNYDVKVEIYDRYARLVDKDVWKSNSTKLTMDLSSLTSGYYLVKIHCKDGVELKKIFKQ